MGQLIAHCIGDYIFQSTWMALRKNKVSWICAVHCFTYSVCFIPLTHSWKALVAIFATHFLIDRFGLARYVVWFKELQSNIQIPWRWANKTGYFDPEALTEDEKQYSVLLSGICDVKRTVPELLADPNINRPIWIRVWLTIIADNTLHLLCNALALAYL